MRTRAVRIALILGLAMVLTVALKTLYDAGELRIIEEKLPGPCRVVEGVNSSEDITVDPKTGIAFISAADRQGSAQGAIFVYGISESEQVRNVTPSLPFVFQPHGLSLFRELDTDRLFVLAVNHRGDSDSIERFEYSDSRLVHLDSFFDPLLISPNDVVAVAADRFYVTNDHRQESPVGRLAEEWLRLSRSLVVYFNGDTFRPVATGLSYANGINYDARRRRLYVASTLGESVSVYEPDQASGSLKFLKVVDMGTAVDNIELDRFGNIWVGGHPKLLTLALYLRGAASRAPSQVLQVARFPNDDFQVEEILLEGGELFSASSVAAVYEDVLLVGSILQPGFLRCDLPALE